MTSLQALWGVVSFQAALRNLIPAALNHPETIRESAIADENHPVKPPTGISEFDWESATACLQTLRRMAASEGTDEVASDLRQILHRQPLMAETFSPAELSRVDAVVPWLLETDAVENRRLEGRRVRDSLLPAIDDFILNLDFRVVRHGTDDVELIPTLVLRLSFDEALAGGSSAISAQIPFSVARRLINALEDQLKEATMTSRHIASMSVPEWSLPEEKGAR